MGTKRKKEENHGVFFTNLLHIQHIYVCLCVYIDVDKCIWSDIQKICVQAELSSSLQLKEDQVYVLEKSLVYGISSGIIRKGVFQADQKQSVAHCSNSVWSK